MPIREDDTSATPPHGDTLRDGRHEGAPASRHGVQLDPRGEPDDAEQRPANDEAPSTPRSHPRPGDTP